jgi:hypothetical protein
MNRTLSRVLGAMTLGALLAQPLAAVADPPAHARNEKSAKHRHYDDSHDRDDYRGHGDYRHYDDGRRYYDDRYDGRYTNRYDDRYDDHRYYGGRYYPPRGYVVHRLPPHCRVVKHKGHRYYYADGAWYQPYGPSFIVVNPPVGLTVSFLPQFAASVTFGGAPYYQAGPVFYAWNPRARGYVVTADPRGPW